ncbi:VOC family protein [Actinoplanes awajinensis]|uniref:Guanylate cyclase n=1 Tax=Actinoplanes awajinensis subsp. mycoplanecinus TaxID=135947 RepID=A0A101JEQ9_9ACTN|nr:VOC family protein [Actinoplanes awajinensis]KUL25337.1 guanylate cyclase [Actinoplanes awajinensis subsp. mycoplanecinus]
MQAQVSAAVPVCYVRDIETSRRFYSLFGYTETRAGGDGDSRWSYLQCGEHTLLLACVQPPLIRVELPLLIYLYVEDLAVVNAGLDGAGVGYELVGYPDHAPGGEVRTKDPDGNVVLVGQRTAVSPESRSVPTGSAARFSLIRQAAEAISRRGGAPASCQIGMPDGRSCPEPAELKLADPWGETVWGCSSHADEALFNARSAFIANEDAYGLGPWLRRRQHHARGDADPAPPERS